MLLTTHSLVISAGFVAVPLPFDLMVEPQPVANARDVATTVAKANLIYVFMLFISSF